MCSWIFIDWSIRSRTSISCDTKKKKSSQTTHQLNEYQYLNWLIIYSSQRVSSVKTSKRSSESQDIVSLKLRTLLKNVEYWCAVKTIHVSWIQWSQDKRSSLASLKHVKQVRSQDVQSKWMIRNIILLTSGKWSNNVFMIRCTPLTIPSSCTICNKPHKHALQTYVQPVCNCYTTDWQTTLCQSVFLFLEYWFFVIIPLIMFLQNFCNIVFEFISQRFSIPSQ